MNHSIKGDFNPCPRCGPKGLDVCSGDPKYCPEVDIVPIVDGDQIIHYYDKRTDKITETKPTDGVIGYTLNTLGWFGHGLAKKYGWTSYIDGIEKANKKQ